MNKQGRRKERFTIEPGVPSLIHMSWVFAVAHDTQQYKEGNSGSLDRLIRILGLDNEVGVQVQLYTGKDRVLEGELAHIDEYTNLTEIDIAGHELYDNIDIVYKALTHVSRCYPLYQNLQAQLKQFLTNERKLAIAFDREAYDSQATITPYTQYFGNWTSHEVALTERFILPYLDLSQSLYIVPSNEWRFYKEVEDFFEARRGDWRHESIVAYSREELCQKVQAEIEQERRKEA